MFETMLQTIGNHVAKHSEIKKGRESSRLCKYNTKYKLYPMILGKELKRQIYNYNKKFES